MQLSTDKSYFLEFEQCLDLAKNTDIYLAETANSIHFQEVEVNHISNNTIKKEFTEFNTNYKPNKVKDTELKVNVILTGDIPIAQRPRRLANPEEKFVYKQIQEQLL